MTLGVQIKGAPHKIREGLGDKMGENWGAGQGEGQIRGTEQVHFGRADQGVLGVSCKEVGEFGM